MYPLGDGERAGLFQDLPEEAAQAIGPRREIKAFFAGIHTLLNRINRLHLNAGEQKNFDWYEKVMVSLNTPRVDIHALLADDVVPFLLLRLRHPNDVRDSFDSFIPKQLPNLEIFPEFHEVTLRRETCQFLADLKVKVDTDLQVKLDTGKEPDQMSLQIAEWQRLFVETLTLTELGTQVVCNHYIEMLQHLLVDPFFNPLDKHACIGNDGNTYGMMSLTLYLSRQPRGLPFKLPFALDSPENFTTTPHTIVKFLFEWLEMQHYVLPGTIELQAQYDTLLRQGPIPLIPTPQTENLRQRRERRAMLERQAMDQVAQLQNNALQGEGARRAQELAHNFVEQVQEMQHDHHARADAMDQCMDANLQVLQQQGEEFLANIEVLEPRVYALEGDLEELREEIAENGREIARLQADVQAFREEIQKRDEDWLNQLIKAAIVAVICYYAAPYLAKLLPANFTAAVGPVQRGVGAMGRITGIF